MSRRVKLWFFSGLVSVLGLLVLSMVYLREKDPIIQGKPLNEWLQGYEQGVSEQSRAKTDEIIGTIGTNAIPMLLRFLRQKDSLLERKLVQISRRYPSLGLRLLSAQQRHYQAGSGFAKLGTTGQVAIPELIAIYNANISSSSRYWAIHALGSMGSSASNVVPLLSEALTNNTTTMEVRLSCMMSLHRIHEKPEIAVPSLINALNDSRWEVRYGALSALGTFGLDAKVALPSITNLLTDPDRNVQIRAVEVLTKLQASN
jgi:HEAT repeat protein